MLSSWVADRAKDFEVIAQRRDINAPVADRALEIVKEFIKERKLILYGGQAIDFALRLKGSRIYPDHQTPDYDFFSPQSVQDAYDLADRLVAAGFDHVSAIPAIHVQTMRVATDFIYVADISFTPREVFDSLPTVSYSGMRVLHPDYQRTDMHLAFCFPFNNPPREDIFHRYKKDLKRFRLLQEHYPITSGAGLNAEVSGGKGYGAGSSPARVAGLDLGRVAFAGLAGYAVLRRAYDQLPGAAGKAGSLPAPAVKFAPAAVELTLPDDCPSRRVTVATPYIGEVVRALEAAGDKAAWFAPYMDSRPLMARVGEAEVFSTKNRMLAVSAVKLDGQRVVVATPQYILLNFLYEAHVARTAAARDFYVKYYRATLDLLEAAGALLTATHDPKLPAALFDNLVESSPFGLPVQTLGDVNWDHSYLIRLAQSAQRVGDEPPHVPAAELPDLTNVPTRYYPGAKHKAGEHPPFSYADNPAFQRAGQELKSETLPH